MVDQKKPKMYPDTTNTMQVMSHYNLKIYLLDFYFAQGPNHHKFSHIFASRGQRWTCIENTYISGAKGYSEGVLCSLLHRDQIVIKNGKGACINKLAISYDLSKDVRNFEPLKISLCFNSTKRHSACRMENPLIQSTSLSPICVN